MHVKIRLLVGDDNLAILEGILNLVRELPGSEKPFPWTELLSSRPADFPGAGGSETNASNGLTGESAFNNRMSVELVVLRKQLVSAIGNIVKGGEEHFAAVNGTEVYVLIASPSAKPQLTPREKDVILLIAGGMATKEVAFVLDISPKTVDFHRDNVKKKIGLRSAALLTRYAIENGWA